MARQRKKKRRRAEVGGESARPAAAWSGDAFFALGLALAVVVVFAQTTGFEFVTYDDPTYVTENIQVQGGLSADGVRWAFTTFHATNWHPLTWLSHMTDVEMHGLDPGGHHLTNVLLHAAAAVLLFLALRRLTGDRWPSALVALLFAVHPLRAESVAWVAERKDVLSGLLWMAVLLAWSWYVKRPGVGRYLVVAGLFALGLLAKPMLVTLPCVLLLLDLWPLRRLELDDLGGRGWRIVVEKLPLLAMAVASSAVTVVAQTKALGGLEELPMASRLGNALVAWVAYVMKSVAPFCLAVFYPHPADGLPAWKVIGAGLVLVAATLGVLHQARRRSYLAVGWLWFVGSLVPVIGIVQVGSQAMADRYSYLPQIGLWIMLAWALAELADRRPETATATVAAALAAVAVLMIVAWQQTATWASSTTLYQRAVECTSGNWVAHANLAEILIEQGRLDEAAEQALRSLEINPENYVPAVLLGNARLAQGRPQEAVESYLVASDLRPDLPVIPFDLGTAYQALGRTHEAEAAFREALAIDRAYLPARTNLGVELLRRGDVEGAAEVLCAAEAEGATDPLLHFNCGLALAGLERTEAAAARLRRTTELDPRHAGAWRSLAVLLDRLGRRDEALTAIRAALKVEPGNREAAAFLARLEGR